MSIEKLFEGLVAIFVYGFLSRVLVTIISEHNVYSGLLKFSINMSIIVVGISILWWIAKSEDEQQFI